MESGKDFETYNKIDELCKRIEAYTTKAISVKSEVKNNIYADKVTQIINMIHYEAKTKGYDLSNPDNTKPIQEEKIEAVVEEKQSDDKYNPNSENFCFKDKLEKNNGNVDALIEELQSEDKLGYRNAYIINEIKKTVDPDSYKMNKILIDTPVPVENKSGFAEFLNSFKKLISKITGVFKGGKTDKV